MIRTEHKGNEFEFDFVSYEPYENSKGLPIIIQLHGAGERGNGDLEKMDVHGFSHLLKKQDFPCVVVMPQCPQNTFWAARVESIIRFIDAMKKKYNSDENKVYLCGISMGGYGTWYTAMARPDLFAAIAPVCGGGMAWNAGTLTMPVMVYHGADDKLVSVNQSDEMVYALRTLGRDVTYHRIDGVGHNVWDKTFDEELMLWLLSKKK